MMPAARNDTWMGKSEAGSVSGTANSMEPDRFDASTSSTRHSSVSVLPLCRASPSPTSLMRGAPLQGMATRRKESGRRSASPASYSTVAAAPPPFPDAQHDTESGRSASGAAAQRHLSTPSSAPTGKFLAWSLCASTVSSVHSPRLMLGCVLNWKAEPPGIFTCTRVNEASASLTVILSSPLISRLSSVPSCPIRTTIFSSTFSVTLSLDAAEAAAAGAAWRALAAGGAPIPPTSASSAWIALRTSLDCLLLLARTIPLPLGGALLRTAP
mmetsp:Transcript_76002/g.203934  ORF Transcript_76002/g.203934 Transcript_76002/m.203934 type:complete len:270 (-) Transcript_76002:577-1386(-)